MPIPRALRAALLLTLWMLLAGAPGGAAAAEAADETPWFDTYSRLVFAFNRAVYDTLDTWSGPAEADPDAEEEAAPSPLMTGIGNMAVNLVNEPMSVVSAAVAGDLPAMARATGRFAINSTVGLLGFYDTAGEMGLAPYHTDLGLALCAYGVGEGPYVVIPFIGPRTLRDGIVDVVVTNLLLYSLAAPLLPPGSGLQTILVVESVEVAADIAATRQIDARAKELSYDDYDTMRDRYLAQRRFRCDQLKAH